LLAGNPSFFVAEVGAVILASVWAFGFTYAMLFIIDRAVTVRVSEATEDSGLDAGLHGEEAYAGI
jgi:Amt family ammonium transporter